MVFIFKCAYSENVPRISKSQADHDWADCKRQSSLFTWKIKENFVVISKNKQSVMSIASIASCADFLYIVYI